MESGGYSGPRKYEGPWWDEVCDARGPLLSHMRSKSSHRPSDVCDYCERTLKWRSPDQRPKEPEPDSTLPHRDDDLIEPRAISGNGATGDPYGLGRGILTMRQMEKLDFLHWLEQQGMEA